MALVFFVLVPSGEIYHMGGKINGVWTGGFWKVGGFIITFGGNWDFVPKFFEIKALAAESLKTLGAVFYEIILAERAVGQERKLAQGKAGLPVGDSGIFEELGVGGTLNPAELEK